MGLREFPLTPLSRSDVAPSAAGSVAAATLSTSTNSSSSPPPVVATGRQFVEESLEWADEAGEGPFGGAAGMGREALATQQCQTTTTPCQFSAVLLLLLIAANGRPCQRWKEGGPAVEVGSHWKGGTQNGGEWRRQWASSAGWN